MRFLIIFFFFWSIFLSLSFAGEIKVFEFSESELSELEIRKVRGADNKTTYTVGSNENGNFLKAVADNAASGLGKEVKIDLNKTPFINITWKIEKDLPFDIAALFGCAVITGVGAVINSAEFKFGETLLVVRRSYPYSSRRLLR